MKSHQTGLSISEPPSEKFAVQYAEAHQNWVFRYKFDGFLLPGATH